jgi:hypothetical protein
MHMCITPELIHFYQTSSLLPSHLPIETSVVLRLLYSLLYSGHIKHFQILGFLPFLIPHVCVLPLESILDISCFGVSVCSETINWSYGKFEFFRHFSSNSFLSLYSLLPIQENNGLNNRLYFCSQFPGKIYSPLSTLYNF